MFILINNVDLQHCLRTAKTMDFRSANKFNVFLNAVTGNFLPMSGQPVDILGFVSWTYMYFTWLFELSYKTATAIALLCYVPPLTAVQLGGINGIVSAEIIVLSVHLNFQRGRIRNLIGELNSILKLDGATDSELELLRRCIYDTVEPHKKRLKMYTLAAGSTSCL